MRLPTSGKAELISGTTIILEGRSQLSMKPLLTFVIWLKDSHVKRARLHRGSSILLDVCASTVPTKQLTTKVLRKIKFCFENAHDWDASTLDRFGKQFAPAAVRMIDGMTLEAYAGSVPKDWDGEVIEVFDVFEMRRLERYHPSLFAQWGD